MARAAILAIDQGTTNAKAVLFAENGMVVARAARSVRTRHPEPGWAEQSGAEIWASVVGTIGDVVEAAPGHAIAAIGIANQRETAMLWDAATGEPCGPAILWQCRRTSPRCAALRDAGLEETVRERTGLGLDPLFSAGKLAWLLDHAPDGRARAARGALRAGTIDSWLLWNLTGGLHATEPGNASRTQLFGLEAGGWDADMAALFDVPLAMLPEIRPSDSGFGETRAGATALPGGIPIRAMLGDSHAALFGHGIEAPGRVKVTCGTGSSLMALAPQRLRPAHGLSATIAWGRADGSRHALEGNIAVSGHLIAFATELLGLRDQHALTELAIGVADAGGVTFVPALAGMGAPHWQSAARGMISGMTLGTRPGHVARAAFDAIALQIRDVVEAAEGDLGHRVETVSVDGGAARNDFLMELLAGLSGRSVVRPASVEISAFGAARMAAEGVGIALQPTAGAAARFDPAMDAAQRERTLGWWREAVERAR